MYENKIICNSISVHIPVIVVLNTSLYLVYCTVLYYICVRIETLNTTQNKYNNRNPKGTLAAFSALEVSSTLLVALKESANT